MHGFDESYFQLFCDFFLDLKEPLGSYMPQLLLNWYHVSVGINVVLGYLGINVKHIRDSNLDPTRGYPAWPDPNKPDFTRPDKE